MPRIYRRYCNNCNEWYERAESDKFCSRECSVKGQKRKKAVFAFCIVCKKQFRTHPFRIREKTKYCSLRCYWKNKKGQKPHINSLKALERGHGWNKDRKMPEISGKNHPNWKGGKTKFIIKIRRCFEYKQWVKKVFRRDLWKCTLCGAKSEKGKNVYLEADHYPIPFSKIIENHQIKSLELALACKVLWSIKSGRALCKKCHKRETKKLMKKIWKNQYDKE